MTGIQECFVWEKACKQAMSKEPCFTACLLQIKSLPIHKEISTIFGTNLHHHFPYIYFIQKAAFCSKGTGVQKGFLIAACYLAFSLLKHPQLPMMYDTHLLLYNLRYSSIQLVNLTLRLHCFIVAQLEIIFHKAGQYHLIPSHPMSDPLYLSLCTLLLVRTLTDTQSQVCFKYQCETMRRIYCQYVVQLS